MLDFETNVKEIKIDISEIKSELKDIGKTLAVNTESLVHHSARTSANEERIKQVENWLIGFLGSALLAACAYLIKH